MALTDKEVEKQLKEAGNKLLSPPSSAAELLVSLDRVETLLTRVEQSPSEPMKKALSPSMKALVTSELLRHSDVDVKVAVASCISEITRITAPDAPYEDDQMKEVFQLIVSSFENLDDVNSPSYVKRTSILETVAKVRSCVVMLDLECDALIVDMFRHFFKTIRSEHSENVVSSMETIMTLVLEESEEISVDLLSSILDVLKSEDKEVLAVARQLGEKVTEKCASKLKPFLLPAMKYRGTTVDDYSKVVANVFQEGSAAVEPSSPDAASKKVADENDAANAPTEKAVEVALETLDDAPPTEEAGPTVTGSPKSVVSNGTIQKENEGISAGDDSSEQVKHELHDEEPSKTNVDNSDAEELIKLRIKPEKAKKRKGKKTTAVKSSSEPSEHTPVDEEEVKTVETEEKDEKTVDNAHNEVPVIDSAEPVENERESEAPVASPKTSDEPADLPSPSRSDECLADENLSKKADQGKKKDELVESVPADGDLEKETDAKKSSEDRIPESKSQKRTGKNASPVADKEDSAPSSAGASKKEDEETGELDAKSGKQSGKKVEPVGYKREDKKRTKGKGNASKDFAEETPAKDEGKKSVGSAKSSAKSAKDGSDVNKSSKSSSKRKRTSGKKPRKYGEELVGSRVQVWWPDDKEFYEGVIELYDSATGKHKVLYTDGDVEHLKIEKEKWKLIEYGPAADQGHASDGENLDDSAEMPKDKRVKTSPVQGAKRSKAEASAKKTGASSSKSKATPKSQTKQKDDIKVDGKAKDETLKSIGKSEDKSGKAKDSKSGNKTSDNTPKSVGKSKDNDDVGTVKGSSKPKQETPKSASKSKGKSSKSGSKSNTNSSSKTKATPSVMEEETEDVESSPEPVKAPESSKGKSKSGSKSKSAKKRKRGTKG